MTNIGATVLHHRGLRLGSSPNNTGFGGQDAPGNHAPGTAPDGAPRRPDGLSYDGSSSPRSGHPEPGAPLAGADLRIARERLGIDLPFAATTLRIREAYLRALEDGRLDALPASAYAIGFLRSYATALGLDPDEMLRRFRTEAAEVGQKTELAFPAPVPERSLPAGAVMLLGVLLLAGVYAGWYRLSGEGRLPAETLAPIPERLAPLAEQAIPPHAATRLVERRLPVVAPEPVVMLEPPLAAPVISPSSAAAAPVNPLANPPAMTEPQPDQSRVIIRATSDAWIQVKDKAGAILLNRVLKPGEVWAAPNRPGLVFTTGNAGGTELLLDGAVLPPFGGAGAVRRDLSLDPDLLKEGRLSSQLPTTPARIQP